MHKHFTVKPTKNVSSVYWHKGTVDAKLRLAHIYSYSAKMTYTEVKDCNVTKSNTHFNSLFSLTFHQQHSTLLTILSPWESVLLQLSWNHILLAIPSQSSQRTVSRHLTIKCWSFSRFIPRICLFFFHILFSLLRHWYPCPWLQLPSIHQIFRSAQTSPLSSRLMYTII